MRSRSGSPRLSYLSCCNRFYPALYYTRMEKLMTVEEVARFLGMTAAAVEKALQRGKHTTGVLPPAVKAGGRWRFPRASADAWYERIVAAAEDAAPKRSGHAAGHARCRRNWTSSSRSSMMPSPSSRSRVA